MAKMASLYEELNSIDLCPWCSMSVDECDDLQECPGKIVRDGEANDCD